MSVAGNFARWMKRVGLSLAVAGLLLAGCQGALLTYEGAKVRDAYRIALADGTERSSRYQSPDLTIDYHTARNGNELRLSGVVEYTPKIRNAYTLIPDFHLSVFLIDRHGTILKDRGISTPGSDDPNNRMRFSENISLPPGTAYIAFSYSGQARPSGSRSDGGGMITPFWAVPVVK
ncbi:MAG: hypothetical protein IH628_01305 [Proteobacteria bacterium]|nr:hypothetical protein [Pseudomonadota bacterium]